MRKTLAPKKKPVRRPKPRATIDPSRLALGALERIRVVLEQSGRAARYLPPAPESELVAREALFGGPLPDSYVSVVRVAAGFGGPGQLLDAAQIVAAQATIRARLGEAGRVRYFPFASSEDTLVAFERQSGRRFGGPVRAAPADAELPVVELEGSAARPRSHDFAHWLDDLADEREESMEAAARIPHRLRELLSQLGFRFDSPLLGRLETADLPALSELLGPERTAATLGEVRRLFDATGATVLTINVDDFSMSGRFRTGEVSFEAEDVFRWLRSFRNENFYAEAAPRGPGAQADDLSRDLRIAPREPPVVVRGARELRSLAARKYTFRAATGQAPDDFYLLGRASAAGAPAPSLILHVVDGEVVSEEGHEEHLSHLHFERGPRGAPGTLWGLTATHAVRFAEDGHAKSFPLARRTPGRTFWYGIGGGAGRVLVWGAGALLELEASRFVPFAPDAGLDLSESVLALHAHKRGLSMLVSGERMGAVASFDGKRWSDIRQDQVIDTDVTDLDVFRGVAFVLDREGAIWREERGARPRTIALELGHPAFQTPSGRRRSAHSLRAFDGGMLVASDGGVIAIVGREPLFYEASGVLEPAQLVRVGGEDRETLGGDGGGGDAVVALCGPHVWLWREGTFRVLDMTEW